MSEFLIRADASPQLGGGHAMRMLTLVGALAGEGVRARFAVNAEAFEVVPALAKAPFPVFVAPSDEDPHALIDAAPVRPNVVIVDHYDVDEGAERVWRAWAGALVVVDDLADRPHAADLILDASPGRSVSDYDDLVPLDARRLIGLDHALLRPDFARVRPRALARRRSSTLGRRVLVTLGLTDVGGATARAAQALSRIDGVDRFDVVIASGAASRSALEALAARDPRFALHVDVTTMAALMAEADVALGAGGQTSLERACMGLPSVTLVLADNQRVAAQALERAGAAQAAADIPDAVAKVAALLDDAPRRALMSAAAAALVDGRGARRCARAIIETIAACATRRSR